MPEDSGASRCGDCQERTRTLARPARILHHKHNLYTIIRFPAHPAARIPMPRRVLLATIATIVAATAGLTAPLAAQHPAQHPAQHRARPSTPPAPTAGLDQYIERAMHDWHVPGLAIAIVHNDSVVLAR